MKLFRLIAVTVAAVALSLATPALAQRAPAAAPVTGTAESHDLAAPDAAPTTSVDVSPIGVDSSASIGSISVVHMFMSADWIVKSVMIVLLIASFSWLYTARIVRSEFLALKEREFLLATRTLGAGDLRLILRHIIPNAIGPIVVSATLLVGNNIITESTLSFFGFGLQPPAASWGVLLSDSESYFTQQPYLLWAPGLAILVTVLAFNLMGDGLRDIFDPRLRRSRR